jgi:hypothetical protein
MVVYDALLKACDARGWPVAVTEGEQSSATSVTIGAEKVGLLIEERVDRVERKPDPKEKRIYWAKEYDYVPTGRLTVRLVAPYLGGVRQSWSDGAKQRVEDCLNAIMVGLVAASEFRKSQRLEQEARQREYLAAEERRREAERRRQREEARVRALDSDLLAWRKAAAVREYAAAMRKSAGAAGLSEGTAMAEWLSWVEQYADRIDPATGTPDVPADPQPHPWERTYSNATSGMRSVW